MSADPYADPITGILRNKLGIAEAHQLQRVERRLTRAALLRLAEQPLPGRYDFAHLQAFHLAIFRDIYPWAGQIRTVNITKTELFALYPFIESSADQTFRQLSAEKQLRVFLSTGSSSGLSITTRKSTRFTLFVRVMGERSGHSSGRWS